MSINRRRINGPFTRRRIRQAFDRLPATPDEIAAHLEKMGIKGKTASSQQCPIALYLDKELGWDPLDINNRAVVSAFWSCRSIDDHNPVENPLKVRDFIFDFDLGRFPQLVADR